MRSTSLELVPKRHLRYFAKSASQAAWMPVSSLKQALPPIPTLRLMLPPPDFATRTKISSTKNDRFESDDEANDDDDDDEEGADSDSSGDSYIDHVLRRSGTTMVGASIQGPRIGEIPTNKSGKNGPCSSSLLKKQPTAETAREKWRARGGG